MKTVKTFILAIIFLLLFSVTVFATEGTVTASSLKLRKEASLKGEILYGISKDEKVEILEKTDDKWYKVKYKDDIGYVSAEYIKTEEAETSTDTDAPEVEPTPITTPISDTTETEVATSFKTTAETDVYIIPVINASIINKIEAGKQVNVIKQINKWAYVESDSAYGWVIYEKLLAEDVVPEVIPTPSPEAVPDTTPDITPTPTIESTPEPVKESDQATEQTGYINVSTYANLRKEPSTTADVLDTLQRNTVVTVISEENGWAKVKVKDIIGYISKDLVSSTKLEEIDTTSRRNVESREQANQETVVNEPSTSGVSIVDFAKKYLGYKYVLGGTTPSGGFDCSGFVYYVFGQIGRSISRSLSSQAETGVAVSKDNLQPGDIVIFNDSSNSSLGHVGIYIGNSQFIHAANPKRGVVVDYLDSRNSYYNERYVTARRV